MGQLRQHPVVDVLPVSKLSDDENPGSYVRHMGDKQSFGLVVARSEHQYTGTEPDQVLVLWSREPTRVVFDDAFNPCGEVPL